MLMKKFVLFVLCMAGLFVSASAANYLHVRTADGWQVFDLEKVDRLTFKGGTMTATDAAGQTVATVPQQSLESMYVNDSAALAEVKAGDAKATFGYDAEGRSVKVFSDGLFEIFALDGKRLVAIPASKGEVINLGDLQPGTVVFRQGQFTLKAIVK